MAGAQDLGVIGRLLVCNGLPSNCRAASSGPAPDRLPHSPAQTDSSMIKIHILSLLLVRTATDHWRGTLFEVGTFSMSENGVYMLAMPLGPVTKDRSIFRNSKMS